MKQKFLLVACGLLLAMMFTTNGLAQIEPIDDFRGIAWGQQMGNNNEIDDLNFIEEDTEGKKSIYISTNDDGSIGTAEVREIYYHFDEDAR